ncbi:MAG: hypothetical protein ACRDPH_11625 [Marmoricola sp.]
MRHKRLISAAVGSVFLASSLVGCGSQAKDAMNKAKDHAGKAAASAKAQAKKQAKQHAKDMSGKSGKSGKNAKGANGAKGAKGGSKAGAKSGSAAKGSGSAAGMGSLNVDMGSYAKDPGAKAVAEFYTVRQAAIAGSGKLGQVKSVTSPAMFTSATHYVKGHAGEKSPFKASVVGVKGSSVNVCVGPKGTRARTLTVKSDKVTQNTEGSQSCA